MLTRTAAATTSAARRGAGAPDEGRATALPVRRRAATALGLALLAAAGVGAPALAGPIERVSVGAGGAQANGSSGIPSLSADGNLVAFASSATNLVVRSPDRLPGLFVKNRRTGTVRRVLVLPGGAAAPDAGGREPAISANGRFVAFTAPDGGLVAGDTNGEFDVFVRDLDSDRIERVSVGPGGAQGDGSSQGPAISADGRLVAFRSTARNLVPGGARGDGENVFVVDRRTGAARQVNLGVGGAEPTDGLNSDVAISGDGRFVAFVSESRNLVPGDTNDRLDVFVRDLERGTTRRASLGRGGVEANTHGLGPALSADGRVVAFHSEATNLVPGDTNGVFDVFVRDLERGETSRASVGAGAEQGRGVSFDASISGDGRFVAFRSRSSNLAPGDRKGTDDVFVRDRRAGTTARLSGALGGAQPDGFSTEPAISADGRVVAFPSRATNLVPGDTNRDQDVFARVR